MNLPTWIASVARLVIAFAMPILLVVSPLYIYVTQGFVRHQYTSQSIPASARFGTEERLRISDLILDYLQGRATVADMAAEKTDAGPVALLEREVQHLVDVRAVMDGFFATHRVGLILSMLCIALVWFSDARQTLPSALRRGVWASGVAILLVLLAALVDFDLFFTRFHQVFFSAGSWLFSMEDTLIQLYPLPFWISAVWKVGLTILGEAGLVLGIASAIERSSRLRGV